MEAYTRHAGAHQVDGDLTKALADSQKAIELKPDDPELYYERGSINWHRLDYSQALLDMDQAIQLNPELDGVYNMRALIQASQGNYEEALASINRAMSIGSPTNASLLDTRGYIYLKMEQYDKAKADYEAIFDQDLRFPYALLGAGLTYSALGEADKAIEMLEEGLAGVEDTETPDPQLADLISMAKKSLEELQAEAKEK